MKTQAPVYPPTCSLFMPAVKVQETAAMSIAQSDVGVNLLGHPLQGRLWHCIINPQLNIPDQQTAQPSAL